MLKIFYIFYFAEVTLEEAISFKNEWFDGVHKCTGTGNRLPENRDISIGGIEIVALLQVLLSRNFLCNADLDWMQLFINADPGR